ncbi:hypothetical protein E2C01_058683 [Portunus trituberculatus]|uniref:Uncharacterized protein n=1 Tax=Portunus trituberculatus TaxID=210409 RepID=A0A5B7H4T9_PORTR|nr:hypothetical protein [Portunus trituberculatus]
MKVVMEQKQKSRGAGGANPSAAASGPGGVCGNQDLLTNLLVYQYLSGNIPGGASGAPPQLAALLASQGVTPATRTVTSVSKTLTTVNVDVPATTHFSTSTTSYVTTITSVDVKTIPVIFRGSRITTTITESSEEVRLSPRPGVPGKTTTKTQTRTVSPKHVS